MNQLIKKAQFELDPESAMADEMIETNDHLEEISDKLEKPLKVEVVNDANDDIPYNEVMAFFTRMIDGMKGDKGEDGWMPVVGKDYFTEEEKKAFKEECTPKKGVDYVDGIDGKNGKDGKSVTTEEIERIKKEVTPVKGKDYFDGKDGKDGRDGKSYSLKEIVAATIKALKEAKEEEKLDISHLRNSSQILNAIGKARFSTNTKDLPKLNMDDQRWHGGGASGSAGNEAVNEVPSGTIDGNNKDFTLANTPTAGTLKLYVNGARQMPTSDYTLAGNTITFVLAPDVNSNLLADYKY